MLIPAPDYPLWTATTALAGGTPVHYLCDETNGWQPDIADIESKITERTKALVVINPNNPTGAVYGREVLEQIVELARKHQLLLLADEIYDKILYDDAKHISLASRRPGPAVPDVQRAVEGVPGGRLPRRLAGHHRAPKEHAEQLPRGHQPARRHAAVPECARAACHSGGARRASEHRGSGAARRTPARAARRRLDQAQRDSRGVVRQAARARCMRSRASTLKSTTSRTTSSWCSICC